MLVIDGVQLGTRYCILTLIIEKKHFSLVNICVMFDTTNMQLKINIGVLHLGAQLNLFTPHVIFTPHHGRFLPPSSVPANTGEGWAEPPNRVQTGIWAGGLGKVAKEFRDCYPAPIPQSHLIRDSAP